MGPVIAAGLLTVWLWAAWDVYRPAPRLHVPRTCRTNPKWRTVRHNRDNWRHNMALLNQPPTIRGQR